MAIKLRENFATTYRTIGQTYVLDLIVTSQRHRPSTAKFIWYEKSTGKEAPCQMAQGVAGKKFTIPDDVVFDSLVTAGALIDWTGINAPQGGAPNWNQDFT